jgi:hypothetical protein
MSLTSLRLMQEKFEAEDYEPKSVQADDEEDLVFDDEDEDELIFDDEVSGGTSEEDSAPQRWEEDEIEEYEEDDFNPAEEDEEEENEREEETSSEDMIMGMTSSLIGEVECGNYEIAIVEAERLLLKLREVTAGSSPPAPQDPHLAQMHQKALELMQKLGF